MSTPKMPGVGKGNGRLNYIPKKISVAKMSLTIRGIDWRELKLSDDEILAQYQAFQNQPRKTYQPVVGGPGSGGHNRKKYKHDSLTKARSSCKKRGIDWSKLSAKEVLASYREFISQWPRKCSTKGCKTLVGTRGHFKCHKCNARYGDANPSRNPLVVEKIRTKLKQLWTTRTSEQNDAHIRNVLRAVCKRPNKFETNAMNYLDVVFPGKFKYSGNGSFIRNGRSADAYSEELKTVALFHGTYWHLGKQKLDITEENKRSVEKVDSLPFLSAGYKVLFIWEDELNKIIEYVQ